MDELIKPTNEKETSEGMVRMKLRSLVSLIVGLVVTTNSFSIIYQKILRTEDTQKYNKDRSDKIAERKKAEAILEFEKILLERDLQEAEDRLKECESR